MWNILVITVLLSVCGYYSLVGQQRLDASEKNVALSIAIGMETYKQAVVSYYASNPGASMNTSISAASLSASGAFPDWANSAALCSQWNNFVDGEGTIYIYEQSPLPVNITADIVKLSQNSVLAGQAVDNGGQLTLYAPADIGTAPPSTLSQSSGIPEASDYGNSHAPIVLPAAAAIPVGSPVWLAAVTATN
jgi:hypothetical protein